MRVDAAFTPSKGRTAPLGIVVDVLRATSTIAQALATGYRRVLCCSEIEEARALRAEVGDAIVGGERTAVRIPGFDAGASPREFLERAQSLQPSGIAERTSRCFARASRARSRSTMRTAPGGSSLPSTAHRALRFGNRSCDLAAAYAGPLEALNARTYGPPGLEEDIAWCAHENVLDWSRASAGWSVGRPRSSRRSPAALGTAWT